MQLLNGEPHVISRTGVYTYQVEVPSAGTCSLTMVDQSGNVSSVITNSSKSADFTGELNLGVGQTITATLTGDALCALTFADVG